MYLKQEKIHIVSAIHLSGAIKGQVVLGIMCSQLPFLTLYNTT